MLNQFENVQNPSFWSNSKKIIDIFSEFWLGPTQRGFDLSENIQKYLMLVYGYEKEELNLLYVYTFFY